MPTLSYKYRIEPNKSQAAALSDMLADFCRLYNSGLEERINAFKTVANARHEIVWGEWTDRKGKTREGYVRRHLAKVAADKTRAITYKTQANKLPRLRTDCPDLARWSYSAEQQVLRRLEKTFKAFFNRGRGFPRFRAVARYHAAEFRVGDGLTIRKNGRVGFVGVAGDIKVRWHRELPSKPVSAILTRQNGKWYIVFHVEVKPVERASPDSIGIDLGLTSLVATSEGDAIERPRWTKRASKKLRRQQRAIARCKKGSKTRRKRCALKRQHEAHTAARRRDFLHFLSYCLVLLYGRIGLEDLNIKGLAGSALAKHVNDAAWGILVNMLIYKAASAGVQIVFVDPRGTSQTCPGCGLILAKGLHEREHRCECGVVLDRDVTAAMVVHYRAFGFWQWPGTGPAALSKRVASRLAAEAVALTRR